MNPYDARPWLKLYAAKVPPDLDADYPDALAMFRAAVARAPLGPAVYYFDGVLSYHDVDAQSDALAAALVHRGVAAGDRVALYLQNTPYFVVAMVAAWKAGAIVVPINPMNREREVGLLLADARPTALICHDSLHRDVVARLPPEAAAARPEIILTTSPLDLQSRDDPRLFSGMSRIACAGVQDLRATIARHRGEIPPARPVRAEDVALLVYTSGTTGVPKGAMNTHANIVFNAQVYRDWIALEDGVGVLGVAPLFHITGLVGHLLAAMITASAVTLAYRFDAGVMLEAASKR
jgi:long-chain acyl-CoA synthetase